MRDKVVKGVTPEAEAAIGRMNGTASADHEGSAKPAPRMLREGGTKTIALNWPMEFDGKEYHELTFRRLTGRDFSRMAAMRRRGSDADEDMLIMHLMTGAPMEVLNALDGEDYTEVLGVLQDFLPQKMLQKGMEMAREMLSQEELASSTRSNSPDGGESSSENGQESLQS